MRITRRDLKRLIEAFVVGPDGDATVPTTDKQKGLGLPKSIKLESRIASLLATGVNASNNHMFKIYKQAYDEEMMKKLRILFSSDDEENVVLANYLADTLGLFDEDANTLKEIAASAIKSAPDYAKLISDVADFLKGTRSDSVFVTNYLNRSEEYSPASYIDMIIAKCLEKHFSLYDSFANSGQIKPNRDYYQPLTGLEALEYLGLDYVVTDVANTVSPYGRPIVNMMRYVIDKEDVSGGVAQQKLSDPRQAYIEGDDPFVVIKFTAYCDYEGSEDGDAHEYIMEVIDDNYSVFVTLEPESSGPSNEVSPGVFIPRAKETYYMIAVSGRLSDFEVTSVDEIENSWLDKQFFEADDRFSGGGFNRPCNMKISEYEEKVLYRNIRELGEVIMKVARAKNYGPNQVKNLRKLITTDQTNNDYYRDELAILMATYSDMIGFTKELAADIEDETGVTLDDVANPEE
jgi:hypothetical protein